MRLVEILKRAIPFPERSNILTPPGGVSHSTKRDVIVRIETGGEPTGRAAALRLQEHLEEAVFRHGDLAEDRYEGTILVLTFRATTAKRLLPRCEPRARRTWWWPDSARHVLATTAYPREAPGTQSSSSPGPFAPRASRKSRSERRLT